MAFANARSTQDSMAEINITPLVDVMLVLLVIFMVTAPLLEQRLPMMLSQESRTPPRPPEVLVLQVQPGDVFTLAGQVLPGVALEQALATRAAERPDLVVKLAIDPDADYQSAATAMAAANRAGVTTGFAD